LRMKKIFTVFLISVFLFSYNSTKAQPYLNLYTNGSLPMGGLRDSNYHNGIGFSIEFLSGTLYKTKNKFFEIRLGLGFEFLHYGSSSKVNDLVFDTPNNDLGSVKIRNRMTAFYVAPKFIFNTGKINPYFDVFGASRSFYTNQINKFNENIDGFERRSTELLLRSSRPHYGGSLGVIYNLGSAVTFDARISYSTGTGIKFIAENSVARDPAFQSGVRYRVVSAPASNILVFRLGVMLHIKKCKDCPKRSRRTKINGLNNTPSRPKKKPARVKPVPKPPAPKKPINH